MSAVTEADVAAFYAATRHARAQGVTETTALTRIGLHNVFAQRAAAEAERTLWRRWRIRRHVGRVGRAVGRA